MVMVIGYGSLMDRDSLSKTIPPRQFKLIWVKDYRRIFNLKPSRIKRYHIGAKGINVSVANSEAFPSAEFNAILLEVNEDEFQRLVIREQSYRVKEIEVYDYHSRESLGKAMLFVGNKLLRGQRVVSDEYLPIQSYLDMVRKAAYSISERFGKDFDNTTYIADGIKLIEYIK